tara:strand:+ start:813 stop:1103 length:291 start_codon:yes stop_codon:yes gene_type:complete
MSNSEEKPLKELVNQMLRAYGLGEKLDEMSLIKSWEDIVGKMIAKHTKDIYFRQGNLYIILDSAPLRQELSYAKTRLVEKLNQHAGKQMVKEIFLK